MKNIFLTLLFSTSLLFAYKSNVKGIYAIGVFDENGNGENVQHLKSTKADYNGVCFSKIFLYGNILNGEPQVKIGNSIGIFQNKKSIYSKQKIKIGEELTYKHFNVTSGLIKVSYNKKLYDSKVFVK